MTETLTWLTPPSETLYWLYAVSGHYGRCTLYQDTTVVVRCIRDITVVRCIRTLQSLYAVSETLQSLYAVSETLQSYAVSETLQSLYAVSGHYSLCTLYQRFYTHIKTLHLPTWCTLRSLQATLAVCCIRDLLHVRCIGDATFAGAVSQLRATVHA